MRTSVLAKTLNELIILNIMLESVQGKLTMTDEELEKLPPAAIDTFRATILADGRHLDLPQNVQKWAGKLKESCEAPGGFTIRVDFKEDGCSLSVLSTREALEDEPEALYIHLTTETIGQLIRVLKLAKKEIKNAERRKKAAEEVI